eukprot:1136240-Pelagomonas_calceolata.AAC.1
MDEFKTPLMLLYSWPRNSVLSGLHTIRNGWLQEQPQTLLMTGIAFISLFKRKPIAASLDLNLPFEAAFCAMNSTAHCTGNACSLCRRQCRNKGTSGTMPKPVTTVLLSSNFFCEKHLLGHHNDESSECYTELSIFPPL